PARGGCRGAACVARLRDDEAVNVNSAETQTLLEVLRKATGFLQSHGADSPRLDAELLMAHALGIGRLDLYLQFERQLSDPDLQPYRDLVARRARGEPVAYLVGHKEFMKLDFEV